jgi:hypothetical protein
MAKQQVRLYRDANQKWWILAANRNEVLAGSYASEAITRTMLMPNQEVQSIHESVEG